MTDPDGARCVRCAAPLPADDRAGLCPRYLSIGTQSGQSQDAAFSPSSPQGARLERWLAPAAAVIGAILLGGLWLGNGWRRESEEWRRKSDALAHYERGLALSVQGKLDEAIAEYRAAIRLKPDHASAHYFLGKALAGQGKPDGAIAEIRKARDNAPRGSEFAQSIEKALNKLDH